MEIIKEISFKLQETKSHHIRIYPEHDKRTYNIVNVLAKYQPEMNPDFIYMEDGEDCYYLATDYSEFYIDNVRSIIDLTLSFNDLNNIFCGISVHNAYMLSSINKVYKILLKYFIYPSTGELIKNEETEKKVFSFLSDLKEVI